MRIVEFYSGIGGMHYAVREAKLENAQVVAAFDVNTLANEVYVYNFGLRPCSVSFHRGYEKIKATISSDVQEYVAFGFLYGFTHLCIRKVSKVSLSKNWNNCKAIFSLCLHLVNRTHARVIGKVDGFLLVILSVSSILTDVIVYE